MKPILLLSVMFLLSVSCTTQPEKSLTVDPSKPNLTLEQAQLRARQVDQVSYKLFFELSDTKLQYHGESQISFQWKGSDKPLRVDFFKGQVLQLRVNNKIILPVDYDGHAIMVPAANMQPGINTLTVSYIKDFNREGSGLYRYKDSEDGRVYLYTDFEPFDANQAFPCLDQPDLKATYQLQVLAPQDWTVISSVRESIVESRPHKMKHWQFPESPRFSTYIWSLHAGPYKKWENRNFRYPLRLFARQSLAKYVKVKDWMTVTQQGFDYFDEYFKYPYPYKKYDQVLVPDFNSGAMENVAAVTFSERFVKRGKKTQSERLNLANVILHEMAHMWFGNLVTMKWWNDLWLNESFATFMASMALRDTEFSSLRWLDFHGEKSWAYWEDQQPTTHPIEANIPNTQVAMTVFDGITYGKGAAMMKQLNYLLDEDKFRDGLRVYFKKHAVSNTELADFMAALEQGAGRSLQNWKRQWLQTANVNTLVAEKVCQQGLLKAIKITQSAPAQYPTLREHALEVAVLTLKGKTAQVLSRQKVFIDGTQKTISQPDIACQELIVAANFGDHAYVKINVAEMDQEVLTRSLHKIQNPLLRRQLWGSVWNSVRDGEIGVKSYGEMLFQQMPREKDIVILNSLHRTIEGNGYGVSHLFRLSRKPQDFEWFKNKYEAMAWQQLAKAKAGDDLQLFWLEQVISRTETADGLKRLLAILDGKKRYPGLQVTQDHRWKILVALNQRGIEGIQSRVDQEAKKDSSLRGVEYRLTATYSQPDMATKMSFLEEAIQEKSKYSLSQVRAVFNQLFPSSQLEMRQQFSDEFFNYLERAKKGKSSRFLRYLTNLAPYECYNAGKRYAKYVTESSLSPDLSRSMQILSKENEICHKILAKSEMM